MKDKSIIVRKKCFLSHGVGAVALLLLIFCGGMASCRKSDEGQSASGDSSESGPSGKVVMTEQDKERAYYFRLATSAEKGDTESQRELGTRYLMGEGLKQSAEKGLYWLHKSASGNNKQAQYALAQLLATAENTEKNATAALQWMTKAADNGLLEAQRDLAAWYLDGKLTPVNWEKAKLYIARAAKAGDADAQYILGEMYLAGTAVEKDEKLAREWIAKAAAQEHPRAKQRLELL